MKQKIIKYLKSYSTDPFHVDRHADLLLEAGTHPAGKVPGFAPGEERHHVEPVPLGRRRVRVQVKVVQSRMEALAPPDNEIRELGMIPDIPARAVDLVKDEVRNVHGFAERRQEFLELHPLVFKGCGLGHFIEPPRR